jgi:hypothetical protein
MSIDEHEPTKEPQELSPEVIQVLAEVQGIFLQCLRAISETTAILKGYGGRGVLLSSGSRKAFVYGFGRPNRVP